MVPGATLGERPASPGPWFSGVIRAARNCCSTRPARRTGWPDERAPATAPPVASWRSWKAACAPAVDRRHPGAIPAPWWLYIRVLDTGAAFCRQCAPAGDADGEAIKRLQHAAGLNGAAPVIRRLPLGADKRRLTPVEAAWQRFIAELQ